MPTDIEVIDLMMGIPAADNSGWYDFIKPMLMDEESHTLFKMPAQYLFKDIPNAGDQADYVRGAAERAVQGIGVAPVPARQRQARVQTMKARQP
jgi:hypothetical protein